MEDVMLDIRGYGIEKYFPNKDYVRLLDVVHKIEDLGWELERVQEEFEDYKNQQENDYNPEVEIPRIHGEGISW